MLIALANTYVSLACLFCSVHVWQHRRWALRHAVARRLVNLADEARFAAALIGANFSNYSAWHHRSALLFLSDRAASDRSASAPASLALTWSLCERHEDEPHASKSGGELFAPRCPSRSSFVPLLRAEFALLQNAFFTEPSDQTAWMYYFWLLAFGIPLNLLSLYHISW